MEKFWVLLMVQAMSEDEAVEAAVVNVKPDIRTPLNKPFLYAKGVYPVEVYVHTMDRIRDWGNAYKGPGKPGLLAFFKSESGGRGKHLPPYASRLPAIRERLQKERPQFSYELDMQSRLSQQTYLNVRKDDYFLYLSDGPRVNLYVEYGKFGAEKVEYFSDVDSAVKRLLEILDQKLGGA